MKNRPNYYQILHVQPDAPREIIRSSYRTMMQRMRMHPDLGGDGKSAAAINEAYAILADAGDRAAYDESRVHSQRIKMYRAAVSDVRSYSPVHPAHCAFCGFQHEYGEKIPAEVFCGNCRSPLFIEQQSHEEGCDRRTITRVVNNQPLVFCSHWPQRDPVPGLAVDISLNGMKFHSNSSLQVGQLIKIESQVLTAVARVTRCQPQRTGWDVGVQFISLSFMQSRGSFISGRA